MCGIAGILHLEPVKASAEHLRSMIAQVRHRGPDAADVWVDRQVGFAHARLSIIDLENGRQPMQSSDGQLVVTFNGEIFNYIELRETLSARGHQFQTRSDTEVILHAYAEYGERCVEHFNGQWAFAVWDKRQEKLMLSRDRLGIRPLFYTRCGGRILFASEIKSLFVDPEIPRELDPRGMDQLFTFWATIPPTTIFREVSELPPGHNLVIEQGKIRSGPYWQLDYDAADEYRSVDDYTEELYALLADATRLRLRADVPVGAYLSGGLDSSVTAALAQRITGAHVKTFSVTFDDSEFDESEHQREVVNFLGVEHHAMHCSHADIARVFPDVIWHAEKPVLRTAPAPLHMLSQLVHASGFKVVLTGEGADEILGGYDLFKEAKVRRFYARCPDSESRAALFGELYPYLADMQAQSMAMRRAFFHVREKDLASPFFSHFPRWQMSAQLKRFFSPEFAQQVDESDAYEELSFALPIGFGEWSAFCQAQYLETAILLPGYILSSQGDRVAMANSVEGRFPFLDHRLAEFAAKVPPRWKMKGLNEKYLLKRAVRGLIPARILARKKQPYRAPDAKSFFTSDWSSAREGYVEELLSPGRLQGDGVFRPDAVEKLMQKTRAGKATSVRDNMAVVGILSTQILVDKFIRNMPGIRDTSSSVAGGSDLQTASESSLVST